MSEILNGFYAKKSHIAILDYIFTNQELGSDYIYLNRKAVVVCALKNKEKQDISEQDFPSLINAGYLGARKSQLYITEEGKKFIRNFHQFNMMSSFAKFTEIFKKNLAGIVALLSLFISLLAVIIPSCSSTRTVVHHVIVQMASLPVMSSLREEYTVKTKPVFAQWA